MSERLFEREDPSAAPAGDTDPFDTPTPGADSARTGGSVYADLRNVAPGLARIAVGAGWRTAGWSLSTSVEAGSRVFRAAMTGESAAQLLQETGSDIRAYAQRVLGVLDSAVPTTNSPEKEETPAEEAAMADRRRRNLKTRPTLRQRGDELLRQSADVTYEEDAHPAYDRILDELAPDEGRILRFLALEGPQPSVDVRGSKGVNITSQLVAPGLSMIGPHSGTRYLDRLPAYLNNLYRLGLIWFSREPLEDPLEYQVLEAQPDVIAALKGTGRGKTVRRSIHLTPFGDDFCQTCLPLHTGEIDALPGDAMLRPGETPGPLPS